MYINRTDEELKHRNESEVWNAKDASDLRNLTRRALDSPNGGKQGAWEIRRGGYDLSYEAYYNGEPAFGVVDGKAKAYQDKYVSYVNDFCSVGGYSTPIGKWENGLLKTEKGEGCVLDGKYSLFANRKVYEWEATDNDGNLIHKGSEVSKGMAFSKEEAMRCVEEFIK